jgi:hypothetical protein
VGLESTECCDPAVLAEADAGWRWCLFQLLPIWATRFSLKSSHLRVMLQFLEMPRCNTSHLLHPSLSSAARVGLYLPKDGSEEYLSTALRRPRPIHQSPTSTAIRTRPPHRFRARSAPGEHPTTARLPHQPRLTGRRSSVRPI